MKNMLHIGSALANFFGYGIGRAAAFSHDHHPVIRTTAARGHGKQFAAQWRGGKTPPSYAHVSRQVRRREQRKALKRMGGAVA